MSTLCCWIQELYSTCIYQNCINQSVFAHCVTIARLVLLHITITFSIPQLYDYMHNMLKVSCSSNNCSTFKFSIQIIKDSRFLRFMFSCSNSKTAASTPCCRLIGQQIFISMIYVHTNVTPNTT